MRSDGVQSAYVKVGDGRKNGAEESREPLAAEEKIASFSAKPLTFLRRGNIMRLLRGEVQFLTGG